MRVLEVPASVSAVTILADKDGTGIEAAHALAARLQADGRVASVKVPKSGKDPNAIL
jgi:DNA primase